MERREDPLLDACLDEVLGGVKPPDLSASILRAWQAREAREAGGAGQAGEAVFVRPTSHSANLGNASHRGSVSSPNPTVSLPTVSPPAVDSPTIRANVRTALRRRSSARPNSRQVGIAWGIAGILLVLLASGFSVLVHVRGLRSSPELVRQNGELSPGNSQAIDQKSGATQSTPPVDGRQGASAAHSPALAGNDPVRTPVGVSPKEELEAPFAVRDDRGVNGSSAAGRPGEQLSDALRERPLPVQQVVLVVNNLIRQAWASHGITPAERATDAEWCRRVYLRLLGRIPTVEELEQFTASKKDESSREAARNALVDQLLASEDFAANWSVIWTNMLIGRSGGLDPEGLADREGLRMYLEASLRAKKPYRQLVFELLTATGASRADHPKFNGAVNFLLASYDPRAMLATSRTSRLFLGRQIHCVQCHDHPTNEGWKQSQYWGMNAFFRQMKPQRDTATGVVELIDADFPGEAGKDPHHAEIYYEQRDGQMKVAYPTFVDGTAGSASGRVSDAKRREELARRLVAAPDLARSLVNRMWAHFFGYGFTHPVDDMGPHNPSSHPEVMERLAGQFIAHDYSLDSLVRWIALSEPFALSSRMSNDNGGDAPEAGSPPLFARYYSRPMQPEEVYESLQLLAQQRARRSAAERERARDAWLGQFARTLATDDGSEAETFRGNIRQPLDMMTGPLMDQVTDVETSRVLKQVAQGKLTAAEKVEHLFLAAVARKPTPRERKLAEEMLARPEDESQGLQDIWWALLNSNEFILDH